MDKIVVVKEIIKEQSMIIGDSLSKMMAESSGVVKITQFDVQVTSDNQDEVFKKLIESYSKLFGQASIDLCLNIIHKHYGDDFKVSL